MSLSIGRDKDIAISRELLKEFTSHKIVGSTAKVKRAFEIVVKNNKEIPVMLELVDQYPVARYSDFKVTLLEAEGAEADSETGKLTWNLPLQAGERRVIRFSYEVKYPKWRGDDVVE